MPSDAQSIAHAINQRHKGFAAGRIELWGAAAVRPNDVVYVITGARAVGNRLDLELEDAGDGGGPISVFDPAGFSGDDGELVLQTASRVAWTVYKGAVWDAVVHGASVRLAGPGGGGTHDRPTADTPALHIYA
jgi:hypothetical protein